MVTADALFRHGTQAAPSGRWSFASGVAAPDNQRGGNERGRATLPATASQGVRRSSAQFPNLQSQRRTTVRGEIDTRAEEQLAIMAQQILEPVSLGNDSSAAAIAEAAVIVEEHPLFPEWLAAFEHLVKAHQRLKAAGSASITLELQKEFAAAKAVYLNLPNELD